jgi:FkbM family methyltransferase
MPELPNRQENRLAAAIRRHARVRTAVLRLERAIPYRLRENIKQWLLRSVHESDFYLFDHLRDDPGAFLDIGANRGHAAISVLRRTRKFRVLSLEPNPDLRWSLMLLRLLHPFRFRFRMIGAGDQSGQAELLIPRGHTDLSSQATLDGQELEKDYVRQRLAEQGHEEGEIRKVSVKVLRVDEMDLADMGRDLDVVKIDVEGWEEQVLKGMKDTLSSARPVLIIEINNHGRWAPLLEAWGYRFFTFNGQYLLHHPQWADIPGLNVICIHPQSPSAVSKKLSLDLQPSP